MRSCIVHIGMHKTGSTAIQTAFYGYNDGQTAVLKLRKPNHTFPMLMIFSARREWAEKRFGIRVTKLDDDIRVLRNRIAHQFQSSKSNFVISGEGLSSHLTAPEIATFKTFLSEWFDDIRIIIYVRDPGAYLRSMFQQTAKSTAISLDLSVFKPRYHDRISGWLQVFGRDKIEVVMFDRHEFEGGSVLQDFALRARLDINRARKPAENKSLRAEGFALTYAARGAIAAGGLSMPEWVRHRTDLYMTRDYGVLEFDFSDAHYDAALAQQIEDITWVERLMQRPFPERKRTDTAVVFASHEDILHYATKCRPEFDSWKRTHFGTVRRLAYLARALRRRLTSG